MSIGKDLFLFWLGKDGEYTSDPKKSIISVNLRQSCRWRCKNRRKEWSND